MIYDAVQAVLSDLDEQGAFEYDDWDEQVADRLAQLEASYRELRDPKRVLIDYSDLATQAAYVFRYVVGHAEFMCDFLSRFRHHHGAPLFNQEVIRVTSVGGGPGSELLGLLKYLENDGGKPKVLKVAYTILDKESNWEHVIEAFLDQVETDIQVEFNFQECDVSDANLPNDITLKGEDLVFMSFFISEICAIPQSDNARRNVKQLLASMSSGGWLVYKDSNAYSFYVFMNSLVRNARGFEQLLDLEANFKAAVPALSGIMKSYYDQFGYGLKLSGNAVSKVYRR
jgi:hypothetical protein